MSRRPFHISAALFVMVIALPAHANEVGPDCENVPQQVAELFERPPRAVYDAAARTELAPHSPWGQEYLTAKSYALRSRFENKFKVGVFKDYKRSVIRSHREVASVVDDVEALLHSEELLVWLNEGIHFKELPELRKFMESRTELLASAFEEIQVHLARAGGKNAELFKHSEDALQSIRKTIRRWISAADPVERSNQARQWRHQCDGMLEEIRTAVMLPDTVRANVALIESEVVGARLDAILPDLERRLTLDRWYWKDMMRKYPKVFDSERLHLEHKAGVPIFTDSAPDAKAWVQKLRDWINSKEIDVIREDAEGMVYWLEVKHSHQKLELAYFKRENYAGQKTYAAQIEEDRQILDFLGLTKKIKLEYRASNGVDDEVKAWLEKQGVRVWE